MFVTVVDGDVPYPPSSGKRLRTLSLLLPLAERHDITFITRADPGEAAAASEYLSSRGIRPIIVEDPLQAKHGIAFYARLAVNMLSSLPYSVSSRASPALRDAVRAHAASAMTDVWQLEWSGYLNSLPAGAGPIVLQAHNVDSLIWKRYGEVEKNLAKRAYIKVQHGKMLRYERRAFNDVKTVVAVSDADAALAKNLYGSANLTVVENGVDARRFATCARTPASRELLFLGALDWRPNVDAIHLLLDEIFPRVRAAVPGCSLMVVGRNPSQDLARRIASVECVKLYADVPDVLPYLGRCAAMAVPLRIGGGSRLKILEALAAGVPVVSSSVGAEGLELIPGRHYALADEPVAFARALADAIEQPESARSAALAGQTFVAEHHDWPALAAKLEQVWLEA